MSRVLMISGHPNLETSNANQMIIEQAAKQIEQLEVRRLDSLYPDYQIDIAAEQQALLQADVIILQYPFYWYSVPALLKKWIDDVLAYDFAYGTKGDKLKGKDFILSFTVGGAAEAYQPQGYNHFPIEELVKPLQQTAYLTGMNFQKPVYSHGMVYIPNVYNKLENVLQQAKAHGQRLADRVKTLTQSQEAKLKRFVKAWFEQFDELPDTTDYFIEHLADDLRWIVPEGEFHGKEGFNDWYGVVKKTFKANCDHQVQQLDINEQELGYELDLRVVLSAETYSDSQFKGEKVNITVNETWLVNFDQQDRVQIQQYRIAVV